MRQAEAHLGRILILNFTKVDLNPMKYKLNIWAAIVVLVLVAAAPVAWCYDRGILCKHFLSVNTDGRSTVVVRKEIL